jgi:hypothetical protein
MLPRMPSAASLQRELERRLALPRLLGCCFDKQLAFIHDPSRRKALFVARRSGKTWAIVVYLIWTCLKDPAVKALYYGLTADSAWDTVYLHMLEPICRQFGIRVQVNLTKRTVTFANGSYIKVTGDDADERQIDKALGGKYKAVVFDECQAITHDLERWIKDKLSPAMVDQAGTLVLAGTAGNLMGDRYWYRVTRSEGVREPGWSVHSWTPFDNPHMAILVRQHLAELKAEDATIEEDPGYQQQWLCRWVVETSARIYKYDPLKNSAAGLPAGVDSRLWRYLVGFDFGFEDDTALVVAAFHPHDPVAYIVESWKKPKMVTQEIAEALISAREKYRPIRMVGDCQNKTLVETLREQYRIPLEPADKLGKEAHIATMNSDFRTSKLKVVEASNRALIKEWDELTWDEKARLLGIFKESPSKDNHLADAALYLHHASKHFRAVKPPKEDSRESPFRKEAERQLQQQMNQQGDAMSNPAYLGLEGRW